ncbi:MAG: CHRD domain-containing protein [Methanococcaceae archaeon]
MRRLHSFVILLLTALIITGSLYGQVNFTARLTGDQEVPAINSPARATAVFSLTSSGLNYIVTIDSLDNITAAHLHIGAIGDTGMVVKTLSINEGNRVAPGIWTINDTEPLTEEMISALVEGRIYINVHTAANPGGEIRGQLLPISGTSLKASLTGLQEMPPVVTAATGTATFILTEEGLAYFITASNLTNITAAHFHLANFGVPGDVIKPITFSRNHASGFWSRKDATDPLTDKIIMELLTDSIYVNIHTGAHPDGEIRGQVLLDGGIGFYANLTGQQETPPVINTFAKATASFTLTNAGLVYLIMYNGIDSLIQTYFNNAPSGSIGGTVHPINNFNGKYAAGIWGFKDNEPLSDELISELFKGNIYINMHSLAHPAGEIRGQITMNTGANFKSMLSAPQVVTSAVTSQAKGLGTFRFTPDGLAFNITTVGIDTVKSAHFHKGKYGTSGTVLRSIREFKRASAAGVWLYNDTLQALTPDLITSLFKGEIYVNIRTSADTLGEIRGQVLLNTDTPFLADLTGRQEVPKIKTNAVGTGSFALTPEGLVYKITVDSIMVAGAHFHLGDIGMAGPVVKDITTDFVNGTGTAIGVWKTSGDQALTPELLKALITGKLYVNVHSPANPNGEIRGQVVLNGGWGFAASLNGFQEVPSTTSKASGTGSFVLTTAGLSYDTTLSGIEPTAAHIHKAPIGQSGDVIKDIFPDLNKKSISGTWLFTDTDTMSADNVFSLITKGLYVNAHTPAFPDGEIRGQIVTTVQEATVSVRNTSVVPAKFKLEQNFPNPFNPATSIRFSLPASGQVNLTVYNLLGEAVTSLAAGYYTAGSYSVVFDASKLASGIYFCRLNTGNNIQIIKMMLLK